MLRVHRTETGAGHLFLLALLVVVVAFGGVGYYVMKQQSDTSDNYTSPTTKATADAPTIRSKSDLKTATTALDRANVDNDLNPDAMNQDLDSLR